MKLTKKQAELLRDLDDMVGPMSLDNRFGHSIQVARSLERRGIVNVEIDEFGLAWVSWDDEAHADWVREHAEKEEAA